MADRQNYKAPLAMRDDLSHEDWKKKLEIWQAFTDIKSKRQGGALFLTLHRKAREAILAEVEVTKINGEDGVKNITKALDKLFRKDVTESSFDAFDQVIKFRPPHSMAIKDYIIEFNIRYSKLKRHKMSLPDGVLAYALLTRASLPRDQEQICRADLKYDDMKNQIEKVSLSNPNTSSSVHVESDSTQFLTAHHERLEDYQYIDNVVEDYAEEEWDPESKYAFYASRTRYSYQPAGQFPRARYTQFGQPALKKLTPQDGFGNLSPCRYCRSIYHWASDCPDAPEPARQNARSRGYPD